jgi:ubiquinone/menaquinone biosynthesis C-methylase UbiE
MSLYDIYEKRVFPYLLEMGMRRMADLRPAALSQATGEVLEIGFGTGLNLPHYPESVRSLAAIDPMDALPERVQERIDAVRFPVERQALRADGALPFDAGRFDTVSVTWTLCTIPEVEVALAEMRRVIKPDGRLLFIEHGRSDDAGVARWQDRLNPLQRFLACGCNLNRQIDELIDKSGFELLHLDRFVMEKTPRLLGSMYRGVARP